jgi:Protein of unknown function (DUF1579)
VALDLGIAVDVCWPSSPGKALAGPASSCTVAHELGGIVKGTSIIEPLFDGIFIEEKIQGELNGMPFAAMAWTGFNAATHQYEATRIASTNTMRIAETGAYDERTGELELQADYPFAGDAWHQRTVIRVVSPDVMHATSYLSFGTIPEWKGVEIGDSRSGK